MEGCQKVMTDRFLSPHDAFYINTNYLYYGIHKFHLLSHSNSQTGVSNFPVYPNVQNIQNIPVSSKHILTCSKSWSGVFGQLQGTWSAASLCLASPVVWPLRPHQSARLKTARVESQTYAPCAQGVNSDRKSGVVRGASRRQTSPSVPSPDVWGNRNQCVDLNPWQRHTCLFIHNIYSPYKCNDRGFE